MSAILTHELVRVSLSLANSEAIMHSSSKATSIVTVSEDIYHVQNVLTLCQCLYLDRWKYTGTEYR